MTSRLIVWDVQHGNAVTVIGPGGKIIWCDAGTGSYGSGETFSPYSHLGTRVIDLLVVSHPHGDHISDLGHILPTKVKGLVANPFITREHCKYDQSPALSRYLLLKARVPRRPPNGWPIPYRNGEDLLQVFCFSVMKDIGQNMNNYSVVTFLKIGTATVCLPGDLESAGWEELSDRPLFLRLLRETSILMASHHGRREGWSGMLPRICTNLNLVIVSDSHYNDTSISSYYTGLVENGVYFGQTEKKLLSTRANGVITIDLGLSACTVHVQKGI